MTDLELIPTVDLIEEVKRRSSFAGIIIWSYEESRCQNQLFDPDDLEMFSSFKAKATINILEVADQTIRKCT